MTVRYRFAAALARAEVVLLRARGALAEARTALAAAELAYDAADAAGARILAGPWATAWSLRDFEGWSAGQAARTRSAAGLLARARETAELRAGACAAARRDADRLERHRARDRAKHARADQRLEERERDEANLAVTTRGARGA